MENGLRLRFEQDGDFCTERSDLLKILAGLCIMKKESDEIIETACNGYIVAEC